MKKDTITITRAEYAQLNKAANAAVEHALELVQASRLVGNLKARIAELEEDNDALERRIANVQADRDEWRHCHAMLQDENAALKSRVEFWTNLVAKMEGEFEELEAEANRFAADNNELRDEIDRLEAERDKLEVEEEDMKTWRKVLVRQAHYTDAAWDK